MNHERLIATLASLGGCCIVMNKGANDLKGAMALHDKGRPIVTKSVPALNDLGRLSVDDKHPVEGPYGTTGEVVGTLGPVRLAGSRIGGRAAPLLHAKLLVLAEVHEYPMDGMTLWDDPWRRYTFEPKAAWFGSANWTRGATDNLEFGLWVEQPDLINHALDFLIDVIRFSEPLETKFDIPKPDLVDVGWDHKAFEDYMRELRDEELEAEAET
jgi:hypothetical protein